MNDPMPNHWLVADLRGGFFTIDFTNFDTGLIPKEEYQEILKLAEAVMEGFEGFTITRNGEYWE